jgi:3-dehydroquinate synthase
MVDAAHGGKTAVNYRGTKNVLGTFYRADAVLVIPQFLDTLPQPEMWNGWAEVVKHMLLALPEAWKAGAANQVSDGITTIRASIEVKQRIVLADPQEKGERKLLNLGHTVGHALEALSWAQKNPIKHGHAVAWGLYTEACIGARVGVTSSNLVAELAAWVEKLYPRPVFAPNSKKLKTYLYQDKKNINGDLMLSLCKSPGDAVYHIAIKPEVVMAQIKEDYFR